MKDDYNHKVHYQYFPRKDCVVCGINQVLQIFDSCIGYFKDRSEAWKAFQDMQKIDVYTCSKSEIIYFHDLNKWLDSQWINKRGECEILAMAEGFKAFNMEPVIGIIGNPKYFAHLETPTLGILAQQSAVATSVRNVVNKLRNNQTMMFFPARFRHYNSQAPDGYAAAVGGISTLSTDANGEYWGYSGMGTIPHLLIAAYGGNTALAALKFDENIDPNVDRVILVDWDNDVIKTTLEVVLVAYESSVRARGLMGYSGSMEGYCNLLREEKLYQLVKRIRDAVNIGEAIGKGKGKIFGVRFDTSGTLVDNSLYPNSYYGVCSELVKTARKTFDEIGLNNLKIIVSGGFDYEKIERFQGKNILLPPETPVDSFGIGSSIVNKFSVDFTADAVTLDDKPNAKVGRGLLEWKRMNVAI